jgi:hypothetical protein
MSGATGISAAVAAATVPAAIRAEGPDAVQGFRAALAFESILLKQMLAEALPESPAGASAGEEEGSAFTTTPTVVSLPETVAEALVGAGGLGIAAETYTSFAGTGG